MVGSMGRVRAQVIGVWRNNTQDGKPVLQPISIPAFFNMKVKNGTKVGYSDPSCKLPLINRARETSPLSTQAGTGYHTSPALPPLWTWRNSRMFDSDGR